MAREAREAMEKLTISFARDEVNKYSLANPASLDMLDIQELAEMTHEILRKHVGKGGRARTGTTTWC